MASADDVLAALFEHYSDQRRYVRMRELANSAGWDGKHRMDFVVMDCWKKKPFPSASLHAFEIKVSRSDWARERRNEEKALSVARYCHTMNLVAPEGVLDFAPYHGWGFWEVTDEGKLVCRVRPKPRDAHPAPMGFIAAMLRRAQDDPLRYRPDAREIAAAAKLRLDAERALRLE